MKGADEWAAGSGAGDFEAGLREELVLLGPQKQMKAQADAIFDFGNKAAANPAGRMSCLGVCAIQHVGICSGDPLLDSIARANKMFYHRLKLRKLDCPVVVRI
eukprot:3586427-Pyramimonas_sp.AAC.1